MEHAPCEYDLAVCADSYLLSVTYEQMKVVYDRFPATEELARIILAGRIKDAARCQMLILPVQEKVEVF